MLPDSSPVVLGTVLYSVESSPVVAMAGLQPAWRTLGASSDDGLDVMQLELTWSRSATTPTAP